MPHRLVFLLIALLGALWPARGWSMAHFAPRRELVHRSEVIAIVDITDLRPLEPEKECGLKQARATLVRALKGAPSKELSFLVPCFYPCAVVTVHPGRHLVFLRRHAGKLQGTSWHLSYRPIRDGQLEWYVGSKTIELQQKPLAAVLVELEQLLRPKAAAATEQKRQSGSRPAVSQGSHGACVPLPDDNWPEQGAWIRPADVASKREMRLARREAEEIRCTLGRYLRSAEAMRRVLPGDRETLRTWTMGALDVNGPRIGLFWVQLGDDQHQLVLRHTLAVRAFGRHGWVAHLRRTASGRWEVESFGRWQAHHRRQP